MWAQIKLQNCFEAQRQFHNPASVLDKAVI